QLGMPKLFLKEITVVGTTMGSTQEFREMLALVERHRIRPVLDNTYPLTDVSVAMHRMEKGDNFGKIALSIP
ncbi:MAG: zinc-binding dehydrogenase, partial [Novibacillus thermophilus]